jgi:hypothetical protein
MHLRGLDARRLRFIANQRMFHTRTVAEPVARDGSAVILVLLNDIELVAQNQPVLGGPESMRLAIEHQSWLTVRPSRGKSIARSEVVTTSQIGWSDDFLHALVSARSVDK